MNIRMWVEDDAWFAEIPDLPGLLADGASVTGAIIDLRLATREWIDAARTMDNRSLLKKVTPEIRKFAGVEPIS